MNEDALAYRMKRGLFKLDEQMAILVQRVSGDQHGENFFPHVAGVGNSSNLYVWDKNVDMDAGMLRLVFGLGTMAVDRTVGDYARIVCLDDPMRLPPIAYEDQKKYSQHTVDVISVTANSFAHKTIDDILADDIKTDKKLFASVDSQTADRLRELGYTDRKTPYILDFKKLLSSTEFPAVMKEILSMLSRVYDYPVDIEFTANFTKSGSFKINLLQCRPLQTRGLGKTVEMPKLHDPRDCFFSAKGNFMGGNVRLPVDYVVYIRPRRICSSPKRRKYLRRPPGGTNQHCPEGEKRHADGTGPLGHHKAVVGSAVHFTELCIYVGHSARCPRRRKGLCQSYPTAATSFRILWNPGFFTRRSLMARRT